MNEVAIAFGALVYLGLAFFLWRQDNTIQELELEVEELKEELDEYRGLIKPHVMDQIFDVAHIPADVMAEQRRIWAESKANCHHWD